MRSVITILIKDLRTLVRNPGLLLALVAYPLAAALLVGLVVQESERRPEVALVNLDDSGRTALVGGERLGVADYIDRLGDDIELIPLTPADADAALADGRVSAQLRIPEGFIAELSSGGLTSPTLTLTTSRRDAVAADAVARELEASVFRLNQRLAGDYVEQVQALVDVLINGGEIAVFGRGGTSLGLVQTRTVVLLIQQRLREIGEESLATELDPLVAFVDQTTRNLRAAVPVAESIQAPLVLEVNQTDDGNDPLTAFGLAAALIISIGLIAPLLAAGAMASESDDGTLTRLLRGLAGPLRLVPAKILVGTVAAVAIGALALIAAGLATDLPIDRPLQWLALLVMAGLALGALGTLIGAVVPDGRTALLACLLVSLPLMVLGIVSVRGAAADVAAAFPFAPAFDGAVALLADADPGDALVRASLLLGAQTVVLGALAAAALNRRRAG